MEGLAFQIQKLLRAIQRAGCDVVLSMEGKNSFGEPDGVTKTLTLRGLYHKSTEYNSGYISRVVSEASSINSKERPMVLLVLPEGESLEGLNRVTMKDHQFRILRVSNLGESDRIFDISLEEIQQ